MTGTAGSAEGPLAGRGSWALGVALPSASGRSLSLWNVRSPGTALGLETRLSSYSGERDSDDLEDLDRSDTRSRYRSLRLHLRPAIKLYRPLHDGVAPFVFWKARAEFALRDSRFDRDSVRRSTRNDRDLDLGLAAGLGTEWFPFQRISLNGRTGLDLSYRKENDDRYNTSVWSLETFETEMRALVYF
ncbi:MAG: hypothetical protein OXG96_09445 [Acidobacteria bacterium]|nr:hypothetical protein [Acidobacteriota bacterium]